MRVDGAGYFPSWLEVKKFMRGDARAVTLRTGVGPFRLHPQQGGQN